MKNKAITPSELKHILARLDWIRILNNAIASRPTSWNPEPVREWRNAGDTVYGAVIKALEDAKIIPSWEDDLKAFKKKHQIK